MQDRRNEVREARTLQWCLLWGQTRGTEPLSRGSVQGRVAGLQLDFRKLAVGVKTSRYLMIEVLGI